MRENVRIQITLNPKALKRHETAVQTLVPNAMSGEAEDTILKVDYKFYVDYLGNVEACLNAVKEICDDPSVIVKASCDALKQDRILIHRVLKKLDAVIKSAKGR